MELILASNSPRRKDILSKSGYKFSVVVSEYNENAFTNDPLLTASTFAKGKAQSVYNSLGRNDVVVLGADTVVYFNGTILGKANTRAQAKAMLKALSGNTHIVITGYALISSNEIVVDSVTTEVTFNNLSDEIIEEYLDSGLYIGKAGSYGIQDPFPLVKSYSGSLKNVIGLPIEIIKPIIDKFLKTKC